MEYRQMLNLLVKLAILRMFERLCVVRGNVECCVYNVSIK